LIDVNNYLFFVPHNLTVLLFSEGGGHGRSDDFGNPNFMHHAVRAASGAVFSELKAAF
jgi:hypothetical protein